MSGIVGDIPWLIDRFGFPYLPVPGQTFAFALLPITRVQAELWLGDPAGPGDDWYAEMLTISPRASWRTPGRIAIPQLLFSGILPEDALRFAMLMGPEYRLPTPTEWRQGDRALSAIPPEEFSWLLTSLESGNGHPSVTGLIRKFAENGRKTVRDLTLLRAGILEWVTLAGKKPGALGRPSEELTESLILDPQKFDPVVPIVPTREPLFGARLIRDLSPKRLR
jgi:hypothetical protein